MTITRIGQHAVKHGSQTDGYEDLMGGQKASVVYTDPPWGQALLGYFQTQNTKQTGAAPRAFDNSDFLAKLFGQIYFHAENIVLVEYGYKWRDEVIAAGEAAGFRHAAVGSTGYKSTDKAPNADLHVFWSLRPPVIDRSWLRDLKPMKGVPLVVAAIAPFATRGRIVLDPCCGMGFTAKAAVKHGMAFRGVEINAARLQKTIDFLKGCEK